MWRQIRDPEFLLGALKTYRMMTGLSQMDPDFARRLVDRPAARVRRDPALPDRGGARAPARRHRRAWPYDDELHRARRGAGRRGAGERLLDPAGRGAPTTRCCSDPAGDRAARLDPGELRRPERRQGLHPPLGQDAARRHRRRLHLRRLPRRGARPAARTSPPRRRSTARSSPAAAPRAPRSRSRRSPRTCSSSTTRTSSPSGTASCATSRWRR